MNVRLEESWREALAPEFEKLYFALLTDRIRTEYQTGTIYPPAGQIFRALDLCPLPQVRWYSWGKTLIMGRDKQRGSPSPSQMDTSAPEPEEYQARDRL